MSVTRVDPAELRKQRTSVERTETDEVRILDLAAFVLREWRVIALTLIGTIVLAVLYVWMRPELYTAYTVVVPAPVNNNGQSPLAGVPLPLNIGALGGGAGGNQQQLISAILKSRSIQDSIVNDMRGKAVPNADEGVIRRALEKRTQIRKNDDGSVLIEVSAEQPRLVFEIVSRFPVYINRIAADMGSEAAKRKREFLEASIVDARERLQRSEEALLDFQRKRGAPNLPEQSRQTVSAAVALQQLIIEKEVEVAQLRRTATADHPQLKAATAEVATLREQLQKITSGTGRNAAVFVPLQQSPELTAVATRLLREYTKDERVYVSLTAALAESQVDIQDDLPVVSVLDAPELPRSPSGTGLPVIVVAAALGGLLLGLLLAIMKAGMRTARANPSNAGFFSAWHELKTDVRRLIPKRSHV